MNQFISIYLCGVKRSKSAIIMSAALGVFIILIFEMVKSMADSELTVLPIGLVDRDRSPASADFADYLETGLSMDVKDSDDMEAMKSDLLDRRIAAIAEIPAGFQDALIAGNEKPLNLIFLDDYANKAFIQGYADTWLASAGNIAETSGTEASFQNLLSEAKANEPPVKVNPFDSSQRKREAEKEGFNNLVGFYCMFVFMISAIISYSLSTDRSGGCYSRIRSSRVTVFGYTSSMWLLGISISLFMIIIPLAYMKVIGTWTGAPFPVITLMIALYTIFVVSFGLLMGMCLTGLNSVIAVIVGTATISSMLGGAYFSIDYAPPLFQKLAMITPQYWVYDALKSYQNGDGVWFLPSVILMLMSLLCLLLTGVRFAGRSNARPINL